MRVAIIHYWLITSRGGERVLDTILELFPGADIFTHVVSKELKLDLNGRGHRVFTTFISRLPFARKLYKNYLPLMPLALEQLDLSSYDLVISSESGPSKGVIVPPRALHICYCHTPMRYVWDMYFDYIREAGFIKRLLMRPIIHYLRMWDRLSADGVDYFIANSNFVAARIARTYRREAVVLHPPVNSASFMIGQNQDDFFLVVGQLVQYKRVDIAVQAFNQNGLPLIVIGEGEQLQALQKLAFKNIIFLGRQTDEVIRDHYQRCRALIFPGVEDFGIVPLEAMASGRPVIAYGEGGVRETVVDDVTGIFFHEQTTQSLVDALKKFDNSHDKFDATIIRQHALKFDKSLFKTEFFKLINEIKQKNRTIKEN